jgi:hypothetical protein
LYVQNISIRKYIKYFLLFYPGPDLSAPNNLEFSFVPQPLMPWCPEGGWGRGEGEGEGEERCICNKNNAGIWRWSSDRRIR